MKKLSPIRSIAWIALSFIAAPFAGVTAAICWVQDKVAGETQDWQQVFQAALDARNGRHTPPTDKEQIIKAAVQAIEDVVEENVRPRKNNRYRCDHDRWDFEHCDDCIREHLIPHMQALKGLIDD